MRPPPEPDLSGESVDLAVPEAIEGLCREFRARGHSLVLVGGSVRDLVLRRPPSSSWDLATSATVYEVSRICRGAVYEDTSHTEFTLAFVTRDQLKLEITPFRERKDYQWKRGREDNDQEPAGTLAQDLRGRDFTINAMAYDPLAKLLFDPHGGRADLARGRVRALPDAEARFRLDPVRILRGVRIAAKLEFEMDPETRSAMQAGVQGANHDARRTLMEFVRLLCGPRPSWSLERLREMGLMSWVCPPLLDVFADQDPWGREQTLYELLLRVLERLSPATPIEAMSVISAACLVRRIPLEPWLAPWLRDIEGLQRLYRAQLDRLLEPLAVDEYDDYSIWWTAVFGCSHGTLVEQVVSGQGFESAWAPQDVRGWPRLAEAWWGFG